jgi:4-amino-4-deoxy-L-arabinose transferase-like glycosyltransferase
MRVESKDIKIAVLAGSLFIVMNLVGLDRSPPAWNDEAICNDPAKELALHGALRSGILAERWNTGEEYLFLPPGQPLVTAAVYKIFGFGIWQTRTPAVVFGGAALTMLYAVALFLFKRRRAAVLTFLLFGLDPKFIQVARSGRMDMQCMFLVLSGLLLFLHGEAAERRRYFWFSGAGLLIGLGGITHPLSAFWATGIGVIIIFGGEKKKIKALAAFGTFAALPVLLWLAWALRTPEQFASQFLAHGNMHLATGSVLTRFGSELMRYYPAYSRAPLLALAYACGLGRLLIAGDVDRAVKLRIVIMFAVIFILNSIIMHKIGGYYYLHTIIFLALAAGAMLDSLLPERMTRPKGAREAAVAAAFFLIMANELATGIVGRYVALACQWRARDYRQVELGVRQYIPPGSVVLGPATLWYAAEKDGAVLRLGKVADPGRYDFVVFKAGAPANLPKDFSKVGEFGVPLPPLFGYVLSDYDYHLQVWRSAVGPASRKEKPAGP